MSATIRLLPNKGKCLFATDNISKGTIIFEEEPYVCCQFSWNRLCKYKACDHCLKPLETAEQNVRRLTGNPSFDLPLSQCCTTNPEKFTNCPQCGMEYCSEHCLNAAAFEYHKSLCLLTTERHGEHPLEILEEAWRNMHYPPETSSIFVIVRLLARIIQSENTEEAIQTTLGFCHRSTNEDAQLAHKFLGEKFIGQIHTLRELLVNALPSEKVKQFLTPEGFQSLIALIGTNGQGIGSSPFSCWRQNVEKLTDLPNQQRDHIQSVIDTIYELMFTQTGDFLNSEGVALYVKQSAANHSCDPNAEIHFSHNNYRLSLVALKDIEAEEEIFISYLGECDSDRSRHSRRKLLMENYLFECDCPKCLTEIDDPDETSDDEMDEEED